MRPGDSLNRTHPPGHPLATHPPGHSLATHPPGHSLANHPPVHSLGNMPRGPLLLSDHSTASNEEDEWSKRVDELDELSQSDATSQLEAMPPPMPGPSGPDRHHMANIHRIEDFPDDLSDLDEIQSQSSQALNAEFHLKEVEEQLQNIFTPTPVELYRVTLHKYNPSEDFGFSLSDGVYEKGVYISAIRPGGPADRVRVLRQFDRLLEVRPNCRSFIRNNDE